MLASPTKRHFMSASGHAMDIIRTKSKKRHNSTIGINKIIFDPLFQLVYQVLSHRYE